MRTVMIARRVGVVIAVLGAVMVLDPKGTASAQATPQAPAPQAAAQAAPQGAPGCPGGNCQPIVAGGIPELGLTKESSFW